ncbi:hypothetical protein [Clostridium sartagoforme]|uniref:hypothetical protein n=1 Tax=Clostridium sartagoforme TaxID=84031 RepID=UPI0012FA25B7|nr:hypothetical protein [Clostridium sartagoforme]
MKTFKIIEWNYKVNKILISIMWVIFIANIFATIVVKIYDSRISLVILTLTLMLQDYLLIKKSTYMNKKRN